MRINMLTDRAVMRTEARNDGRLLLLQSALSVALVCVMAWWFTEGSQGFCGWPGCRGREMCTVIRKSEIGPRERSAAIREKKKLKMKWKMPSPPAEGTNTWVFV